MGYILFVNLLRAIRVNFCAIKCSLLYLLGVDFFYSRETHHISGISFGAKKMLHLRLRLDGMVFLYYMVRGSRTSYLFHIHSGTLFALQNISHGLHHLPFKYVIRNSLETNFNPTESILIPRNHSTSVTPSDSILTPSA